MNRLYFLCLLVLNGYGWNVYAESALAQWVVVDDRRQKVLFYQNQSKFAFLYGVEITFLGGQTKYAYKEKATSPLRIKQDQFFALTPEYLYKLANLVVPPPDIERLNSIRLRWLTADDQYVIFNKGCSDLKINCTLPIHCHPSVEICDFDDEYILQKVIF